LSRNLVSPIGTKILSEGKSGEKVGLLRSMFTGVQVQYCLLLYLQGYLSEKIAAAVSPSAGVDHLAWKQPSVLGIV
jgi:hypothetical protein